MAPEQALGEAVTPAADLYGVGVMLYEMLTGLHPFDPPDRTAMLSFHIVAPVPLMEDRAPTVDVPKTVELVVRRLLEKDSKKRYESARALVDAIAEAAATSAIDLGTGSAAPPAPAPIAPTPAPWVPDDSFAKTSIGTPAPNISTAASLRQLPRGVLIAVAAALPVGFLLVIGIVLFVMRGPKPHPDAPRADAGEVAAKTKPRPPTAWRAPSRSAPTRSRRSARSSPEDATLLGKLAVAYQSQGRTADALRTVRALVTADPKAANDDEIVQLVATTAAKGKGEDDDEAFALLEGPFGEHGVDALIELTAKAPGPAREGRDLRARAAKSLAKPEVRAHASAPAGTLLDLKAAVGCAAKHDLLGRVKEVGDSRMTPTLKSLKSNRGCGFLNRSDCWGLHASRPRARRRDLRRRGAARSEVRSAQFV